MIIYGAKALLPSQKGNIRDNRPVWTLEEMGEPYELIQLDPGEKRENMSPEYLRLNPFGKVPALKDGDFVLFESSAICAYLGDKFKKLIPAHGTRERALYDQWVFAAVSTFEPSTMRVFVSDVFLPPDEHSAWMKKRESKLLGRLLKGLDRHLEENAYLLGNEFSIADIVMTCSLHFIKLTDLIEPYRHVSAYLKKNYARPAYQRMYAQNGAIEAPNQAPAL